MQLCSVMTRISGVPTVCRISTRLKGQLHADQVIIRTLGAVRHIENSITASEPLKYIAYPLSTPIMGSSDIAPDTAPTWLVPASTVCLSTGVVFWLAAYVLMVRRSLATKATPAPLLALAMNLSWEVVYAFAVCEAPMETVGFAFWLLLDIPVLYATLKTAPRSFASSPLIARNVGFLLAVMFAFGVVGNGLFVWWWLKEPHRGYGVKWGKNWKGREARDTTELAWWSAGVAQMAFSVSALAMLLQRGHSGGQSYAIW